MSEKMLNGDVVFASHEDVLKSWFESDNQIQKDEEIEAYLENFGTASNVGQIVTAIVVSETDNDVFVDVGYKSEGIISKSEFRNDEELTIGKEIEVFLEGLEDLDGNIRVSKTKAIFIQLWGKIEEIFESNEIVKATILKRIKGGMLVDLMGVDAFLPGSQIDVRAVTDMDEWVGQEIDCKVVKINKMRRNIVVSRRAIIEDQRSELRGHLLKDIEEGQIRKGIVKNITDYGLFIDLGGVDGLLHITDMSWGRISHPSEIVKVGEEIEVKILSFDKVKERISLGLKQLEDHPWNEIEKKYSVGQEIQGRVVAITDYGAFVEVEKGIEGLIHVSEMSWDSSITHPSKILKEGETVSAKILAIDEKDQKISLGIKQLGEDPWAKIEEKFPAGEVVDGKVCNLTTFGIFVELDGGIDGLVHISDLSWTKKINNPSELFKKDDKIKVVILGVDKTKRRISLGYKQLENDPWDTMADKYPAGTNVEAKIVKIMGKGLICELDDYVEAIVPMKDIAREKIAKLTSIFAEGNIIPAKIRDIDKKGRKIIISIVDRFEGDDAGYDEWWAKVNA